MLSSLPLLLGKAQDTGNSLTDGLGDFDELIGVGEGVEILLPSFGSPDRIW
jgi:hypothetical protein